MRSGELRGCDCLPSLVQPALRLGAGAGRLHRMAAPGRLPLLAPMSAIAGNMAALVGAFYLARFNGGRGVQLGEVLGQRHGIAGFLSRERAPLGLG